MEKVCLVCKVNKSIDEFYVKNSNKDGRRSDCIICYKEKQKKYNGRYKDRVKEWYNKNKKLTIQRSKEWKENNSDRSKELNKKSNKKRRPLISKYCRERYHSDNLFRMRDSISSLIGNSFRKKGYSKKSKTNEILGIDYEGFMVYIESKFTQGMTWENKGDWEIDHKIPVSYGKTEKDIIKLNHYSNLQPLWKEDNRKKSNKLIVLPSF
jgi:hypothetical protein